MLYIDSAFHVIWKSLRIRSSGMKKAVFFEEAIKEGLLATIDAGYILSMTSPDLSSASKNLEPLKFEMISYSGVKSAQSFEGGVKFQAQGRKMFCMIEPSAYTQSHIEPTYRPTASSGYMPFRFSECETFMTKNDKFRIHIPDKLFDCYDSFTVSLPKKGDMCILYLIFDKNIDDVVLPFIKENIIKILKTTIGLSQVDSKRIGEKYIETIQKYDVWEGKQV
jgi:hypothetical protein